MTRFKTIFSPHNLEPEILAGQNHFEIWQDGENQGTYNRPDGMNDHELSNELYSYCVDIVRGSRRTMASLSIRF